MSRCVGVLVGTAAGLYVAVPLILKRAFAPPRRDGSRTPSDLGLPQERVWLESVNGTRLHGWFIPVEARAPAVVVVHGWGGNAALMLPLAPHLHEAGFHALFLDARNHGLSENDSFVSMPRFAEDVESASRWLRAHPAVTSVGVIGHSVGAGAAILSASRGDLFDAVVSVAAPARPGDLIRDQMSRIPEPLLAGVLAAIQRIIGSRFESFAPRNRIALATAPILLVHGDADPVVPIDNLYELRAAQPAAEVLVVPNGDHTGIERLEHHMGEVIDFLDRHLRPDGPARL